MFRFANVMKERIRLFFEVKKFSTRAFYAIGIVLFASCGTDNQPNKDNEKTEEYLEFRPLYLSKVGLPAMLMIPDETANIGATTEPEIIHEENDFLWTIKAGPNFTLRIEDFGDYGKRLADKKQELKEQNKFAIRYLINRKNVIVYEQTLIVNGLKNAPPQVGIEHSSLHVLGQSKIDGIYYELRSPEKGYPKYQRQLVNLMAKSIQSFKASKSSKQVNY